MAATRYRVRIETWSYPDQEYAEIVDLALPLPVVVARVPDEDDPASTEPSAWAEMFTLDEAMAVWSALDDSGLLIAHCYFEPFTREMADDESPITTLFDDVWNVSLVAGDEWSLPFSIDLCASRLYYRPTARSGGGR